MSDVPRRGNLSNYIPTYTGAEPKAVNPKLRDKGTINYSEYFARDSMKKPEKGSGELSKIREKPGESNAFKKREGPFAGPDKTYPIPDLAHARNALARANFAKNPEAIKRKVHVEYPGLAKRANERQK